MLCMFPGVCYQLKVELTERSKPNRIRPIFQFLFPGVSKSTPQSIATTRHPEKMEYANDINLSGVERNW